MQHFVIVSYWWGLSDNAEFADTQKIECIVVGDRERADRVVKEKTIELQGDSRFCYADAVETTVVS